MKNMRIAAAGALALTMVGTAANAQETLRVMPSAGQAAFSSEATLFSRSWQHVCYTGGGTAWRAWLNAVEVPTDASQARAIRWVTNDPGLTETRIVNWLHTGELWKFSPYTVGDTTGWITDLANGPLAVHTRFKSNASGTQPCLTTARVEWF